MNICMEYKEIDKPQWYKVIASIPSQVQQYPTGFNKKK